MNSTLRWARNVLRFYRLWLGKYQDDSSMSTAGRPPVILISGWGNTPNTMSILRDRLARDGFAPFIFSKGGILKNLSLSVEEVARVLEGFIEQMCKKQNVPRAAIIGHSLGGLIGRFLVSHKEGHCLIHTLITLGAPHCGSPIARVASYTPMRWISPGVIEAAPDSRLLRKLASRPIPPDVYCAALFSHGDYYCPASCAQINSPGESSNVVNADVGDIGHVELVIDKDTYRIILRHLNTGLRRAGLRSNTKNEK